MTVRFNQWVIPGINEKLDFDPPAMPVVRTSYWGLHGESEIRSGRGGRHIRLRLLIRDLEVPFESFDALLVMLDQLEALVGEHGQLTIENLDNGLTRSWERCTFMGFQPGPEPTDGPLPDVAGAMGGGWWIRGVATWYDLGPPLF